MPTKKRIVKKAAKKAPQKNSMKAASDKAPEGYKERTLCRTILDGAFNNLEATKQEEDDSVQNGEGVMVLAIRENVNADDVIVFSSLKLKPKQYLNLFATLHKMQKNILRSIRTKTEGKLCTCGDCDGQ